MDFPTRMRRTRVCVCVSVVHLYWIKYKHKSTPESNPLRLMVSLMKRINGEHTYTHTLAPVSLYHTVCEHLRWCGVLSYSRHPARGFSLKLYCKYTRASCMRRRGMPICEPGCHHSDIPESEWQECYVIYWETLSGFCLGDHMAVMYERRFFLQMGGNEANC